MNWGEYLKARRPEDTLTFAKFVAANKPSDLQPPTQSPGVIGI